MTSRPDDSLIARLRDLPAAEKNARLEQACNEDPSLRERLPAILSAITSDDADSDLQTGQVCTINSSTRSNHNIIAAFESALASDEPETSGTRIAHYKLLQEIGEGGFGVVWMAEQLEPIRRRVALKIIKLGMDTKEVIARFEAERQALALMDHPNIARVFDAGATETGRPYFAMELVRGVPITRYCDENRLSAAVRLQLFITVCHAVQHAHQKGVIHRDLKPSNILVTLHDGVPVPKIIDFGIAKATSAHLTDKTLFTQFHAFIGTPAYTSPEQMEMSGLDVDTRSDIYSLGVLLYELLTGRPPFDPDALAKSGLEAMRRTIREIDPPRPSARLVTLSQADRTSTAQRRGTDAERLSLLLRGDLDWVVMHALEKDRTRRYETPDALAADVQRHLANEPVTARPPSNSYRLQKFVRRHRVGFFAAMAVAVSLVAGLIASSLLLLREQAAHQRAVVAERAEGVLRQQTENARREEVKRAARTALDLANQNLADGRVADGLAYLVYAARKDPANTVLASRLASVLASHRFALPEAAAFECGSRVVAIQFSLDGRTCLVGTEDGTMRVFDASTEKIVREFRLGKPVRWVSGWIFARSNDQIFGARFQDNSFALFDSTTGRQQGTSVQLESSVRPAPGQVGLSPDGRWLCAIGVERFWLWDTVTGEKRFELTLPPPPERERGWDFDFSPDSRRLSLVTGNEVRLLALPECLPIIPPFVVDRPGATATNTTNIFLFARFFGDSHRLAICDPYEGVRIVDSTTGTWLSAVIPMESGFDGDAWTFMSDDRLIHDGRENLEIRDLKTGHVIPLSPPGAAVHQNQERSWEKYSNRDGTVLLAISNGDRLARLWDTKTGQLAAEIPWQLPTRARATLSPDGTLVAVGNAQGTVNFLRVGGEAARPLVLSRLSRVLPAMPLVFLPEAPARLLWFTDDRARALDVASGREVPGGVAYPRKVTARAPGEGSRKSPLRADLRFLVVRSGTGWEAWELSTGGAIHVVPLQGALPQDGTVTFSPEGDLVALAQGTEVRVWNLRSGACMGPTIDGHSPLWSLGVIFSPDGQRLVLPYVDAPAIWDVTTGRPATRSFEASYTTFRSTQFSPDGSQIITANHKGEARLWSVATGQPLSPVMDGFFVAAFSPDGRNFVTRGPAGIRIWDTATAAPVGELISVPEGRDLRFSADSRHLIIVSADGNARVFDVRTAQAFTEPMDHGPVRLPTCYVSPDGLFVRTETTAGDFRIWSVPPALPDATPPPEWLLQLGNVCAGKFVNDEGQLTDLTDAFMRIESVRAQVAALPADAPLADWGRWILNDRADRSIAPGFTITPAEAEQLAAALAASYSTKP